MKLAFSKKKVNALCREGFFCCCETQVPASFLCVGAAVYSIRVWLLFFLSEEIARSVWLVVKLGVRGGEDVAVPQSRLHFLCRRRTG